MTDLTKITEPFGLLSPDVQEALSKASMGGAPMQHYTHKGWENLKPGEFSIIPGMVVRQKPHPPKPREWWINIYPEGPHHYLFESQDEADEAAYQSRSGRVHVREIMEGEQ